MRKISLLTFGTLLIIVLTTTNCLARKSYSLFTRHSHCLENIDIDIKNGTLILENKYDDDQVVEITEEYELYVNGNYVSTNRRQNEMIKKYYDQFMDIIDYAKEIGHEGARIGVAGAKIGLKAAVGMLKVIFSDYTRDEFADYLEEEAEELEERAEELEEKAEEIEEMAEDFEDFHHELKESVPELERLKWF